MRSTPLRLALPLLAALALAGCKKEGIEGPDALCRPVSMPCSLDSECCSYGCLFGRCAANPLEDGSCRTSDDCLGRVCVDQHCTSSVSCLNPPDTCDSRIPCCSGICLAGICKADQAPVAVAGPEVATHPYRIPIALTNGSYDPDTSASAGISYQWTVVSAPAGSTATFAPSATFPTPTFTPDVADATTPYVLRLRATNAGGSGEDTISFHAVNVPPAITMPAGIVAPAYQSRNVALAFSASISDADGGPATCSWSKTSPTGVTTVVSAQPETCAVSIASGAAAAGQSSFTLDEDQAGVWQITLAASDGVNPPVTATRNVNVQNDAPELLPAPVAAKMATRYGNVGRDLVPLHGSVFDRNGDTVTWQWTVTGVRPPASVTTRFVPASGEGQDVQFEPDAAGLYTLNLHVDDGHGGVADKAVDVIVDPYVLPFGEVVAAEYVSDTRIVMVGTDGTTHKLWVVNPATPAVTNELALASRPTALGVSPDGDVAVVGREGGFWDVVNLSTVTLAGPSRGPAFTPSSIAWAAGYAFAANDSGAVRELLLGATVAPFEREVQRPASVPAPTGTALVGRTVGLDGILWVLDHRGGALARYPVKGSNAQLESVTTSIFSVAGAGLWLSATGAELFAASATALDPSTFSPAGTLPAVPQHLSARLVGTDLQGALAPRAGTTALVRFAKAAGATSFTHPIPDLTIPFFAAGGERHDQLGRFAFVHSAGGTYYAVVSADLGTLVTTDDRWGLVTLTP